MSNILDIIIPMYNTPKEYISRALTSISRQKNVDFNEIGVILIDDASTKIKYKKSYFKQCFPKLNITLLQNKVNSGAGVTRQNGIDASTAEYVTFLDSDDEFYGNEALYKVIALMKDEQFSTDRIQTAFYEEIKDDLGNIIKIRHGVEFSCLHGYFVKKSLLDKYNLRFHPTLRYHEDSYFISITKNLSLDSFIYFDEVTYLWKWNDNSLVRTLDLKKDAENFKYRFQSTVASCDFLSNYDIDIREKTIIDANYMAMLLCSNQFDEENHLLIKEEYTKQLYDFVIKYNIFDEIGSKNNDIIQKNLETVRRSYDWLVITHSIDEFMNDLKNKYWKSNN